MKLRSIANKLLFAFSAIALMSLVAAIIGLGGFQSISDTQDSVVNKAVPILRDAHSLTELNSDIGANAQRMVESANDRQRLQFQQSLGRQFQAFGPLLTSLRNQGIREESLQPIAISVENLQQILGNRTSQIGNRIRLKNRLDSLSGRLIENTVELNDMADSLVANAATTTTAVTSSLYDLVEQDAPSKSLYEIFDRLIEVDIDALERMYELRQSSADLNQIVSRVAKETQIDSIDQLERQAKDIVSILQRRVDEINDPQRKSRARQLIESVHLDTGPISISNIFASRRSLLELQDQLVDSERQYNAEAGRLNAIVGELSESSGRALTQASAAAQKSLQDSRQHFLLTSVAALLVMAVILWRYVHHDVIRRLLILKEATLSIAKGKLGHPVDDKGNDELSEMASALRLFRDNAIDKVELDKELQQYKDNLEQTVRERTMQLEQANERLASEVAQHDIAREKAEQANQAKTDFLATISHELRTPLSGALGTLNLLRQTELASQQIHYLNAVDTANSVLLDILDNVLGYSQVRAGKVEVEEKEFDLHELVSNVVSVMRASASEKGNKLTLALKSDVPKQVIGDSGKLTQVLMNLLGNAAKFTENGEIRFRLEVEEQGATSSTINFAVIDTGIGMDITRKEEMFKAFTQADTSIARRYGGIGLGLAICRRLISWMGGSIELESEQGVGTTISFTLPFTSVEQKNLSAIAVKQVQAISQTVLLVEDDPTNREVAHHYLMQCGHKVIAVNTGESALNYLKNRMPDLILLDISLPGISGLEVLAHIRNNKNERVRELPVIAMSAHVFEEEVEQYLAAGMNGFLGKPFSPEDLDQSIAHVQCVHTEPFIEGAHLPSDLAMGHWRTSPIIEKSIIEQDIQFLGRDKVDELLDVFVSSGEEYLAQFRDSTGPDKNKNVALIAHKMKSASGNFGFLRLSALLQHIEENETSCDELLLEVAPLFRASNTAAEALLERR